MSTPHQVYVGDGVYMHFDGWYLWLTTPGGNEIALEPGMLERIVAYDAEVRAPKAPSET